MKAEQPWLGLEEQGWESRAALAEAGSIGLGEQGCPGRGWECRAALAGAGEAETGSRTDLTGDGNAGQPWPGLGKQSRGVGQPWLGMEMQGSPGRGWESRADPAGAGSPALPLPQLCSQLAEPRWKWVTRGGRREPGP